MHEHTAVNGKPVGVNGVAQPLLADDSPWSGLSPAIVLHTVRRAFWWACPLGLLLAGAAAAALWYLYPIEYAGTCWIQILSLPPTVAFEMKEASADAYARTQVEFIKSPMVLRDVLSMPEVAALPDVQKVSRPLEWIGRRLEVRSVGGSEFYTISVRFPQKPASVLLANAVLDSYLAKQPEYINKQAELTIALLESELEQRGEELKRLRENMKQIAANLTRKDPTLIADPTSTQLVVESHAPIDELHARMADLEVQQQVLLAEKVTLEKFLAEKSQTDLFDEDLIQAVENHPTVTRLIEQLQSVERSLELAEQRGLGQEHPQVQVLLLDKRRLEEQLVAARDRLKLELAQRVAAQRRQQREEALNEVNRKLELVATSIEMVRGQIAQEKDRMIKSGDHSLEFSFARQEVLRAQEVYDRIAQRITAMKTELRAPKRVQVMRRASEDTVTVARSPWKYMMFGGAAAFLLPFLLAIFWEKRAKHLSFSEQVQRETSLPVLAEVSRVPTQLVSGRKRRMGIRRAMFEESIDQLRISLLLSENAKDKRIYALVSAVSGEGKTSIASQLALSVARTAMQPILIIDADMRAPSLHHIFRTPGKPGLAEVLAGEATLEQAIVAWDDYVHVLPAGHLSQNPNVLVTNGRIRQLFDTLKEKYPYVLVDCPPLLAATEAYVIAREADGAMLCVMRDVSRSIQVRKAYERLKAVGAETVGLVLSGVPTYEYAYRYGGYTRYYKRYYRDEFVENTRPTQEETPAQS